MLSFLESADFLPKCFHDRLLEELEFSYATSGAVQSLVDRNSKGHPKKSSELWKRMPAIHMRGSGTCLCLGSMRWTTHRPEIFKLLTLHKPLDLDPMAELATFEARCVTWSGSLESLRLVQVLGASVTSF